MFFSNINSSPPSKSALQIKRQSLHQSRANEEKEKIKKSMRFIKMKQMLFQKDQTDYDFILQVSSEEAECILKDLLKKNDLVALTYCINKVQQRIQFGEILSMDFLRQFVQFSQDLMHQPQIIFIYYILCSSELQFYKIVFDRIKVIEKIVKQIQSLKLGDSQDVYLQVLESLSPHYPKRFEAEINGFFGIFLQMMENQGVAFGKGLKILKAMSPFINQERSFSFSIVSRIVECYQKETIKQIKSQSQSLMIDCFIVLVKIIYYQKDTDIITNMRLMKLLLHAKISLPSKVVEEYYNIFVLLGKLVEKTGQFEVEQITREEFVKCKKVLIENYCLKEIDSSHKQNYLTTLIVHHIFTENKNLLSLKQFSPHYLNFILDVVRHCSPEIIIQHFMQMEFFQFLTDAVNNVDINILAFALEIILTLLNFQVQNSQILALLKDYYNFSQILSDKVLRTQDKLIYNKIILLLEKFEQFNHQ